MRNLKWLYACSLAIAFGVLSFTAVSCHDDDDEPKQEPGEEIVTPDPVVEYYIMGTVTDAGKGLSNVDVKIGSETIKTDKDGKFSVTEKNTGKYSVEVAPKGYLAQNTSVEIAANAENRSVVTVAVALTKQSEPENVKKGEDATVKDNSDSNKDIPDPTTTPADKVVEDLPIATVEVTIPKDALPESGTGINEDGSADISVTTYVPAPEEVTTEVKPAEENKDVEKTIPLAAAHFEPSGLEFANPVTISIPNPIPDVTFAESDMQLTYLNTKTGKWDVQTSKVNLKDGNYQAAITHFSSYAVENKVTSKVSSANVTTHILGHKEKAGWECKDADITNAVKSKLTGASDATINAMVAFFKTRLYSLMGSTSGVKTTERTYNTVNVNGYTTMNYTCYAKTRTTTLSAKVLYKGSPVTISVTATRYTGTDHQYKTVTTNPTHIGGKGGSN